MPTTVHVIENWPSLKQVNLAIEPSQITPGAVVVAIFQNCAISETKRRRTFNVDSIYIYMFCEV